MRHPLDEANRECVLCSSLKSSTKGPADDIVSSPVLDPLTIPADKTTVHPMQSARGASSPNRLDELIARDGVKLSVLAAHCDVDQSTLWRWRTGETDMRAGQIRRIAEFFHVSPAYLMRWDGDQPEEAA